jgi:hypothetical protein
MRVLARAGAFGLILSGLLLVTSPAWSDQGPARDPWGPAWSGGSPGGSGEDGGYAGSGAEARTGDRSQGGAADRSCQALLSLPADEGGSSGLDMSTTAGQTVLPGEAVTIRLAWEPMDWPDPSLDKAADCVTVDGKLDASLSREEEPTLNDGKFEHSLTLPQELPEGAKVCGRGFLAGDKGPGVYCQNSTDAMCFVVGAVPTLPKVEPPATPPAPAAPPPQVLGRQQETLPAPAIPVSQAAAPPTVTAPAAAPAPLAATGPIGARPLMLSSGLALMLGGFGLMAGTRRPALGSRHNPGRRGRRAAG